MNFNRHRRTKVGVACYRGRSRRSAGRFGPGRGGFDRRKGGGGGIRGPITDVGPWAAAVRAMREVIVPRKICPHVFPAASA